MVPLTFNGVGATNIDASGGTISLDGSLNGSGGLNEIGSGILVLDGTGTYTGGTTVASGELIVANNEAIEEGTSLAVGADAGSLFAAEAGSISTADAKPNFGAAPVPEPATLALLAAGSVAVLLARRRGRH
jgi:autotransporter-associated beta strand protein